MQLHQLNYRMREHVRELRHEAHHHCLLMSTTPPLRMRLATALRAWALRLEQARDARSEAPLLAAEQLGQAHSGPNLNSNNFVMNDL